MRELNRRYRGIDRTTDVLAFGQALPRGARDALAATRLAKDADGRLRIGDVVIAGDSVERQARRRKWTLAEEVAFLAAHGALHLIGHEDDTSAGYREMRRRGAAAVAEGRRATSARARRNRGPIVPPLKR